MPVDQYAGYTLTETISTEAGITHWRAIGPDGVADVFLGPPALLERARILPDWPPFSKQMHSQPGFKELSSGSLSSNFWEPGANLACQPDPTRMTNEPI